MATIGRIVKAPLAPPSSAGGRLQRWCRQIGWMMFIWSLSVITLGICAGLMRLFMHAMGMR
jgi:hypothetical protein